MFLRALFQQARGQTEKWISLIVGANLQTQTLLLAYREGCPNSVSLSPTPTYPSKLRIKHGFPRPQTTPDSLVALLRKTLISTDISYLKYTGPESQPGRSGLFNSGALSNSLINSVLPTLNTARN